MRRDRHERLLIESYLQSYDLLEYFLSIYLNVIPENRSYKSGSVISSESSLRNLAEITTVVCGGIVFGAIIFSRGSNPTDADGLGDSLRRPTEARSVLLEERLDFGWRGGPPSVSGFVERHFRQAYFRVTALDGSDRRGRRRRQTNLLEGADREESALTLGAAYRAAGRLYLGPAS